MNNKYFISTAIPYINAQAHIGHAQEFVLADTIKRLLQSQGKEVILQSGTDDNSLKNILASQSKNISIESYVEQQGEQFKYLLSDLNVNIDLFVQTSKANHHQCVDKFIRNLDQTDLFLNSYKGLYCVGCEDFLKTEDLNNKGECPDHLTIPKEIEEENTFFKLSRYQDQIYKLIDSDKIKITPFWRKKEILNFIQKGLTDISISRPIKNQSWGVLFPNKPDQTVYVWIDALINYISGIGYGESDQWKEVWNSSYKVHVIGKNVWKFHAIYWVGLLLSANILPPNELLIHGFLTNEGLKISKSLGNTIDPLDLLKKFEADTLRTYLVGKLNSNTDGDFSESDLSKFYEDEIINQIGNLFPRVWTLADKNQVQLIREKGIISEDFRSIHELYNELLNLSQKLNKEINDSLIWKSLDQDKNQEVITNWNNQLNIIADQLCVFYPSKESEINKSFKEKTILFKKR